MRNVKLLLEYDGTNLAGWQRQANAPTVQQHLEDALAEMVGEPIAVTGCSRTDSGVHALGQVANFRTSAHIPAHGFRRGLNGLLPASIAILAADDVADDFDARRSARGKHYRYSILTRETRSPLLAGRTWHRPRSLDVAAMREAAAHLVGEHDFEAFRAAGCQARTTRRRISVIDIEQRDACLAIDVRGNAFLRNMVRILTGTLVAVGEGRLTAGQMPEILASRDRTRAGVTAPPQGLCLVSIQYG